MDVSLLRPRLDARASEILPGAVVADAGGWRVRERRDGVGGARDGSGDGGACGAGCAGDR